MKKLFESWRNVCSDYNKKVLKEQDAGEMLSRAYAAGPEGVRAFLDSSEGKDPKVRQVLGHPEASVDGKPTDDKVSIKPGNVTVSQMVPTQKFIDLMQSVSFPLGSAAVLRKNINAKKGHGPITTSDNYIIDGHHRWSGIFAVAPEGTITVTDIGFPGNAKQKLASAQLAIGAIDPNTNDPHPSKGGKASANILGKDANTIYKLILQHVGKQTDPKAPGALLNDQMINTIISTPMTDILDWANIPEESRQNKDAVIKGIATRTAKNLAQLPDFVPGAPDRPDMPQFDHKSIGGDKAKNKVYSKLATNRLNIVPPFTKKAVAGGAGVKKELQEKKITRSALKKIIREELTKAEKKRKKKLKSELGDLEHK